MATRSIVARPAPGGGFAGRYVHNDGEPTSLVFTLSRLVLDVHGGDVAAVCRALLDDHPNGWSTLPSADKAGECLCHSGSEATRLDMGLLTDEGTATMGLEYAYVLHADRIEVFVPDIDGTAWTLQRRVFWPGGTVETQPAATGEDDCTIRTRVCIDDMLGPYDALVDPDAQWNGRLSPHFTLDTVRELATRTQQMADEYGHDSTDTIHVIDGGADIEGEARAVVLHIRWQYLPESGAATVVEPNEQGLYGIGGWEWTWHFAGWTCACSSYPDWHITECPECGRLRDPQLPDTASDQPTT